MIKQERVAIWNQVNTTRNRVIRGQQRKAVTALNKQLNTFFDRAEQEGVITPDMIDILIKEQFIEQYLIGLYLVVGLKFGRPVFKKLLGIKQEFQEGVFRSAVLSFIRLAGADRVKNITATTKKRIRTILKSGVEAGLGVREIVKLMRNQFKDINRKRAMRIARTEVINASNFGAMQGATMTNLDLNKEWISTLDSRTRQDGFDHVVADGQIKQRDEPFIVSGQSLRWPVDSSLGASAGNTIQCRCTLAFIKA